MVHISFVICKIGGSLGFWENPVSYNNAAVGKL